MVESGPAPHSEKLICPSCSQTLDGDPSACPHCGGDLRGLGATNETLAGSKNARRPASSGPSTGDVIDRRYKILDKLGEGGMGAVYKVEHVRMGKLVALKLLRPEAAFDRNALKRFHQEAQIVSKLSHPNTVSVFDFGELPDGALFMAMEYVPGRDLARLLEAEGAFSERRAVLVAIQILRSLAEAHDAGIVHRDVKPANVMLLRTREGEDFVKLLDFGIAKLAEAVRGREDKRHTTGAGDFGGTPRYRSPEQVAGEPLDGRSDLYSLGALLFELLTGKSLFDGPTPMAIAAKHLNQKPPRTSEIAAHLGISPGVEAVLEKALAKNPRDRYRDADEMRAALTATRDSVALPTFSTGDWDKARTGELAIARRDDWDSFERSLRWRRRFAPLAALLVLAGAGAGGFAFHRQQAPPPSVRAPVTSEVEPNDGPRTANLVAPGTDVKGLIQRLSRDKADHDLYEFAVQGTEPVHADLLVSGVPNVNLALDLFLLRGVEGLEDGSPGASERLPNLGQVDDQFLGSGERMTDLKLAPGRYLVRVADKRRPDEGPGAPRENTLDEYSLRVELSGLTRYFEDEPNNLLAQAMRLSAARPVFGHAGSRGESSQVKTSSGELAAVAGLWSDDYYELVLPPGATTGCAFVTGVRGATLSLSVVATEKLSDRVKMDEHLAKMARSEKAVRVSAGEVDRRCARAAESVVFKLAPAEGASWDRYLLVAIDDSDDGFVGALNACHELVAAGEAATCRALLEKSIAALPISKSVEAAKAYLRSLATP
ncbi:MAG: serine/threonine protein kinase [Deltaproteobacteria bacterium]|nr:serine/threonine protein kinase [Deltaproteobacteria bacterium]